MDKRALLPDRKGTDTPIVLGLHAQDLKSSGNSNSSLVTLPPDRKKILCHLAKNQKESLNQQSHLRAINTTIAAVPIVPAIVKPMPLDGSQASLLLLGSQASCDIPAPRNVTVMQSKHPRQLPLTAGPLCCCCCCCC